MKKLLKQKETLQRELGNNYGTSAVPLLCDCLVETSQVFLL